MSFVRCHACRGQKKIKGLGCMLKKCLECQGTGYIEQDNEDNEVIEEAQEAEEEQIVKTESTVKPKKPSRWVKKDK
jgi:hypothetical protein